MTLSTFHFRCIEYISLYIFFATIRLPLSNAIQTQRTPTENHIRTSPQHIYDLFGPPPNLRKLDVGQSLPVPSPFSPQDENEKFQVICLSKQPHMFLLRSLVPPSICQQIMSSPSNRFSTADTTEGNDSQTLRHDCQVAWMDNHNSNPALLLGRTTGALLLSDAAKKSCGSGCEPMQVLKYTRGVGEFVLHHDGICRIVTVLYYLNGVGGTWFPFAGQQRTYQRPKNRKEALQIVKENHLRPGYDGLLVVGSNSPYVDNKNFPNVVVVKAGDAVAFYNYRLSSDDEREKEEADWFSLHAGLPTFDGEKWIANHWMHAPELFKTIQPTIIRR